MLYGSLAMRPRNVTGQPRADDETVSASQSSATPKSSHEEGSYKPSVVDVLVVKVMLNRALKFPPEIVDIVIDVAEYWPHYTVEVKWGDNTPEVVRGRSGFTRDDGPEDKFLIRTPPLGLQKWGNQDIYRTPLQPKPHGGEWPTEAFQDLVASPTALLSHPCRRIRFTIRSHDQGWGGSWADEEEVGPYSGSWTWFEAGLERWCRKEEDEVPRLELEHARSIYPEVKWDDDKKEAGFELPLAPKEDLQIQANITADHAFTDHIVTWNYNDDIDPEKDTETAAKLEKLHGRGRATGNGKFVRELRIGDMVTVWAKARFPAWCNFISSVKVEVYWAI